MGFKTITAPTTEPISIGECRSHLHWDLDSDLASETDVDEAEDALILDKLGAAREYAEGVTGLFLAPRLVEKTFDHFPCPRYGFGWVEGDSSLRLDYGPVREIESIEYVNADGVPTELPTSTYVYNDYVSPARIDLAYGERWPDMRAGPNAVKVRYWVGYGVLPNQTPAVDLPLPRDIKAALLLTMAHLLENKEDSAPIALASIPTGTLALLHLKRENLSVG